MVGSASQRWLDHAWGPAFTAASGLFIVALAAMYERTYRAVKERHDEACFRRIRNVHRYLTRPIGWAFVSLGILMGLWRLAT